MLTHLGWNVMYPRDAYVWNMLLRLVTVDLEHHPSVPQPTTGQCCKGRPELAFGRKPAHLVRLAPLQLRGYLADAGAAQGRG